MINDIHNVGFLSEERLEALLRQTSDQARSFTDPKTGTAEIRVLELLALLDELWLRRAVKL